MRKYRKWLGWGAVLAIILLLLWFFYYGIDDLNQKEAPEKYSVILYQYTENSWASLQEGVEQAATDHGVTVNYVTMAIDAGIEDQEALIDREIENGAQGLLVAAVDSQGLEEKLADTDRKVPVVTVETGVGDEITHIGADDYKMGYKLGKKILEDYQGEGRVAAAVIKEYMERRSVQERYRGVMDALKEGGPGVKVVEWNRGEGDYNLALYLKTECSAWAGEPVIALDKYTMEELLEGCQILKSEFPEGKIEMPLLYGIGNTDVIVNGLDQGQVQALVYQNEFNAGYQGMEALIQKKKKKVIKSRGIKYQLVTRDTLYETENQRLLFPII
ncbi:MAG: sugar ABC transporter substrate-binding protein [Blautia sp.]|jgi:ribose transport system substrate-binding protein